jgi:hypothetical protein
MCISKVLGRKEELWMAKISRHPRRAIPAVLTLAIAAMVLVLVIPIASAGSPSGKNQVAYYTNSNGAKTTIVGEDELFNIVGKNLNHAVEVYCWAGGWIPVTDWSFDPNGTSKLLVDVDVAFECSGTASGRIAVEFDTVSTTPGTPGNAFILGPRLAIHAGDPDL